MRDRILCHGHGGLVQRGHRPGSTRGERQVHFARVSLPSAQGEAIKRALPFCPRSLILLVPSVPQTVPFVAVASAGAFNAVSMRFNEFE